MKDYDHTAKSKFTLEECQKAIGTKGAVVFTGVITEAGESNGGPYVKFLIDEKYGFGSFQFVVDLELVAKEI